MWLTSGVTKKYKVLASESSQNWPWGVGVGEGAVVLLSLQPVE